MVSRKAAVVATVRDSRITMAEALHRYQLLEPLTFAASLTDKPSSLRGSVTSTLQRGVISILLLQREAG